MSFRCGFSLRWPSPRGGPWQLQPYTVPQSVPSCSRKATSMAVLGPAGSVRVWTRRGVDGVGGIMGQPEVGQPVLWTEREVVPKGRTRGRRADAPQADSRGRRESCEAPQPARGAPWNGGTSLSCVPPLRPAAAPRGQRTSGTSRAFQQPRQMSQSS